jgi:integrase
VLEYGKDSTGRRLQKTKSGFPTRAAAHEALAEVVRQLGLGATVHSLTVGQYLEDWLLGKHALKPKTVAQYRDMTENYLMPHLGRVRLLELRASHLDAMYAAITIGKSGRPLSPSTIRRIHAVLRSALNTAVKRRMIPYSPAEHIELAPENPKRPRPWNISEARVFLAQVSTDRLGPLYELMLSTGLRRGEAIGLRWQDVDLDGGALFVVQQSPKFTAEVWWAPRRLVVELASSRSIRAQSMLCTDIGLRRSSNEPPGALGGTTPILSSHARTDFPFVPNTQPGTSWRS